MFLAATLEASSGSVVALGSRNPDRTRLRTSFGDLPVVSADELIIDEAVDAIYIATPHSCHAEWAIKAAQSGKHVLCEKPLATSANDVGAMVRAAAAAGTFLGEAFMYRFHPLTQFILSLVRSGRIGSLQRIQSTFGFAASNLEPTHRLLAPELGGGAILDLGCYPVSMCRLLAGCELGEVVEPKQIKGLGRIGPTGVDLFSSGLLEFPNGVVAEVACSIATWEDNVLRIIGTDGRLEVDEFWLGTGHSGGTASMRIYKHERFAGRIPFQASGNLYRFQFDAANLAILSAKSSFSYPGMSHEDSIGNAVALDRWLSQVRH